MRRPARCAAWTLAFALILGLALGGTARAQSGGDAPFKEAWISIAGAQVIAVGGSPYVLVDFSDYQCPYCRRFAQGVLPAVLDDYVLSGVLRYAFMDYPLHKIHPQAVEAAYAAWCAGEQGRYWEMHDLLFGNQKLFRQRNWGDFAAAIGIGVPGFQACIESGRYSATVGASLGIGQVAGVRGTPTFFLGVLQPDGQTVHATHRIGGAMSLADFRKSVDWWLRRQPR